MGTRIADYFVISGLDVTSGLEPDQLSGKQRREIELYVVSQEHNDPLFCKCQMMPDEATELTSLTCQIDHRNVRGIHC